MFYKETTATSTFIATNTLKQWQVCNIFSFSIFLLLLKLCFSNVHMYHANKTKIYLNLTFLPPSLTRCLSNSFPSPLTPSHPLPLYILLTLSHPLPLKFLPTLCYLLPLYLLPTLSHSLPSSLFFPPSKFFPPILSTFSLSDFLHYFFFPQAPNTQQQSTLPHHLPQPCSGCEMIAKLESVHLTLEGPLTHLLHC